MKRSLYLTAVVTVLIPLSSFAQTPPVSAVITNSGIFTTAQGCGNKQCLWAFGSGFEKSPGVCEVNYYHGDPIYPAKLATVLTQTCGPGWINAEIPASLSLLTQELRITVTGASAPYESAKVPLSLSAASYPAFHVPGTNSGDASFGNQDIVIGTTRSHGGAINYLAYKGYQILDQNIGTDFQTAYTFNWQNEGLNPTEAGNADNALFSEAEANAIINGDNTYCVDQEGVSYNAKYRADQNWNYFYVFKVHESGAQKFCSRNPQHPSSTSDTQINYFKSFPGMIESTVSPAYWLRPGETSSQGMATEGRAINTALTAFDQTLSKRVIVGYRGNPNIISYQNSLNLSNTNSAPLSFPKLPTVETPGFKHVYDDADFFQMNFYSIMYMKRPYLELNIFPTLVFNPLTGLFRHVVASDCDNTPMGTLPAQICNFTQPVILSAPLGPNGEAYYVGAFSPDQNTESPMYSLQQYVGSAVNGIAVAFDHYKKTGIQKNHAYLTFYVVGDYMTVQAGLMELMTEFGQNTKKRVCELKYQQDIGKGCPQ